VMLWGLRATLRALEAPARPRGAVDD